MNSAKFRDPSRLVPGLVAATSVLAAIIAFLTLIMRVEMRENILQRDAEILSSVSAMLVADLTEERARYGETFDPLEIAAEAGLLASSVRGVIAISLHHSDGSFLMAYPDELLPIPLAAEMIPDAKESLRFRYHPQLSLAGIFNLNEVAEAIPMVEVALPLRIETEELLLRFWLDGDGIAKAFKSLDRRLLLQSFGSWFAGSTLLVSIALYFEKRVRDREEMLDHRTEELREANLDRELQAKASAIGNITSSLIHDLRNPLGKLQLAISGEEQNAAIALESAKCIQEIITEVIEIIRDQDHVSALPYEWTELVERLRHHFSDERLQVDGEPEVELRAQEGGLVLLCLKQVLANALRASPEDAPVRLEAHLQGQILVITVTDQGGGLPERLRKSLFRPIGEQNAQGSGIGLTLARQIAVSAGGELSLKRSDPTGTAFELRIPIQ